MATPAGETYALSGARRYRWEAVGSTDPAEQNFGYQMVTRHAPDGTPTATALFGQPWPDGTPSAIAEGEDANLAVLPDGTVAVSSKPGSTHLISSDKPFKALTHFTLLECTPAGELLLAHRKQHLLLRVPVPKELDGLAAAVEAALKGYGRGRTALKRQYNPVN
ncbi:hypothetical protein OHS81_34805 [Streptomyces sp. NBC_00400]|uniref:hypothetical protein n=1 Tax=Streptomyces sp. NBC_00400 TaxID=2975737 RepID=UPI002E22205E